MELPEFLLACFAEDEKDARTALIEDAWSDFWIPPPVSVLTVMRVNQHIARHDPTRVLAECDAKRLRVTWATGDWCPSENIADGLLRWEALPYADHPDYREEWRP